MIPQRYAPILFGFLLSGMMSLLVTAIATFRAIGMVPEFASLWMGSWVSAWLVAFPAVLVAAPITRRLVAAITRPPS
ncbi:Protein of unknown function [Yoonia tamlensis]|uniref:DUF2798 domain-containing protein n=1 Tax=Yoonia tamlensis TaxID=390270 RepID=A0A1I6GST4_9RHOB|nr:DUF2798 domain-containing protein [Yoonia tamlensis]SFR45294.1 Protein of unknown function [Yoonia tamlensis]